MLLDAANAATAREVAKVEASGDPPELVREFPAGVFLAEIVMGEEGAEVEPSDVQCEIAEHVQELLFEMEPGDEEEETVTTTGEKCGAEAEDENDAVVACALLKGHAGPHDADGLVWT
jgi:hypothetical protein